MSDPYALLAVLADGKPHRPAALAEQLHSDPDTISAQLQQLHALGLSTRPSAAHGVCLERPLELLRHDTILAAMEPRSRQLLSGLDICLDTDSSNARLRRSLQATSPPGGACLSESQSAGRGRRGRRWISPAASNIYLSIHWHYPPPAPGDQQRNRFSTLSLALSVAANRALNDIGLTDAGIKWPNDLVCDDHKIGGILIESSPWGDGGISVIAGIGVNTHIPDQHGEDIGQAWTDISRILGRPAPRNRLAARLLHHLLITLSGFADDDADDWRQDYARQDILRRRNVTITRPDGSQSHGIACGIDHNGALLINADGVIDHHLIGEASVRSTTMPAPGTPP